MPSTFEFFVRLRGHFDVRVGVRDRTVELVCPRAGFLCAGLWDAGGYVRFARASAVPVHPLILDEIDAELRLRMPGAVARDASVRALTRTRRGGRRRPRHAILDLPPENLRRRPLAR